MLQKTIKLLLIASTFQVASSWAGVMDIEGSNTSGYDGSSPGNDTTITAQNLGTVSDVNPLTVFGWIDNNNANDVDFYQFSVTAPSLTLFFDIDFAYAWDQVNYPGDNNLGLDAALWIFNTAEELIAWNDDSDFFITGAGNGGTDPGSDQYGYHDSFIGGLSLANGSYFAAVSYFGNAPNAWFQSGLNYTQLANSGEAISGATPDTSFENLVDSCFDITDPLYNCTGQYQLQIRTSFNPIPEPVPEPAFFTLAGAGLLSMYARRRFFSARP